MFMSDLLNMIRFSVPELWGVDPGILMAVNDRGDELRHFTMQFHHHSKNTRSKKVIDHIIDSQGEFRHQSHP
ncbi:hypothetical protein H632_c63p2 [Helicosporidium sp. ATCC 50920]|nr:hypothetical protein H632_c63p2 [Helicosporidium sp. ATCC 50920]|eukprot:KDD76930.1 hypothetical protein H632_c63p2 [Helicosporidium sp. ATCC 50920]